MSEQKPEAVWVFPEEKKRNGGRIALIVAIVVVVLLIAAGLAFFLIPRGGAPAAMPTATPTASPSASATPTPSPTVTTTPASDLPTAPVTTPPAVPDPSVGEFRSQVQRRLDVAVSGLDKVQGTDPAVAAQVVDSLQNDGQNLASTPAPESIRESWSSDVTDYLAKLQTLRTALDTGSDASAPLDDARAALTALRSLVGL